jgi:molecular chaperone GrpE
MEDIKNTHENEQAATVNETVVHNAENSDALAACKKEMDSWKEKYVRVSADLENFSKRVDKERVQWRTSGQTSILTGLLDIVDDFDRAFEQAQKAGVDAQSQSWVVGFELIHKALHKFLETHDVKEMAADMPFDTQYHEALMEVESPDHTSGQIVAVLQKGYTFKGNVLRVAKVSVAK